MLRETEHCTDLARLYEKSNALFELRVYGYELYDYDSDILKLDMKAYVKDIIKNYNLSPDEEISAFNELMEEAYQTLYQPINNIYPYLAKSSAGEMILCDNYSEIGNIDFEWFNYHCYNSLDYLSYMINIGEDKEKVMGLIKDSILSTIYNSYNTNVRIYNIIYKPYLEKKIDEVKVRVYNQFVEETARKWKKIGY